MLLVKQELLAVLAAELDKLSPGAGQKAAFESPKVAAHGDFASTAAMQLAKPLKLNPRQLAEGLRGSLLAAPAYQRWVDAVEIAGPGFINFRLKPAAKQETVREVLTAAGQYGVKPVDKTRRVVVEFVSANPTGPLHVGHGRQAALGDAICNLFATQGWDVYREFYYNDAGVQIHTLATSTQARAKGLKPGDALWPEPAYNGDYIDDIARDFIAKKMVRSDDREFTASGDIEDLDAIRQFAVAYLRHEQDLDLQAFAVGFDNYYLESSLYSSGRVEATVAKLKQADKTYEQDGALWLKSTDYGDDKDRVMKKSDGSYTYFVPDVAYHLAKWERGFTRAINIQGMDHHGTIARVRAGLQAAGAGIPQGYPDYVLHTMVRVMRHGEEVKISKRAGSYVTLRDLIEWTSKDAVRFFLLSRKPDTEYVFDIDLALAKNNENPVYYVQYAHARICSVLAAWGGDVATLKGMDLSALDSPQAQALMLLMAKYPDMLANAATGFAPHDVAFYLRELAASYHSYYDAERILVDDEVVKLARLALVAATAQVLHNGLKVLGVDAPQKM
ncbi:MULTISPECIES: arginine--tRNA ligase [unclassified Polaromonas]|jgi:arginyl-tRNA synthetase|uniref:arginine--tRNA ligase n=1 Tax=unclassified Polaromonas TaxID=2638319 RepID=UPI000BC5E381|nr:MULTISPECIES: arginine--tRNA ligase [unclassified Polaromonas]OYY33995.1 MAG: arginine--tRNA ligase [Polaromonas sp. 35-63-35]OYZ20816.1 MAG: arginine--tRNA ligase [Polaromonas sp. 16-63-31]OYZ78408.1 MAG: arginine--tRNA ligase [Polaromonas sp. 24-63-21]OZA49157.1 MAG: arginine--tRNA ligase [Polaromonas sp. 17-63-33]OZA85911.1 MAG: arginine--tRNA ligase [Polaromonas sp. 39-63-25]